MSVVAFEAEGAWFALRVILTHDCLVLAWVWCCDSTTSLLVDASCGLLLGILGTCLGRLATNLIARSGWLALRGGRFAVVSWWGHDRLVSVAWGEFRLRDLVSCF